MASSFPLARVAAILAALQCLVLCLVLAGTAPALAGQAKVLRVRDGDSFWAQVGVERVDVRLIGLDCPEYGQEWGDKAREYTEGFLAQGPVILEYDRERRDRYDRLLAYVRRGGRMLNLELVERGLCLAVHFEPNGRYRQVLENAQAEAREAGRGFWAQGGLEQSPREYRRAHRSR